MAKELVEYLPDQSNKENDDPHSDIRIESITLTGPQFILIPCSSTPLPTMLKEEGFKLYNPGWRDLYPLTIFNFANLLRPQRALADSLSV